ncbi:MAG: hypothetical protein IJZ96_04550, partial [Lachnospiraceae bacterium]|nr:hypothetical protein [Lachnospiraceae bacterium]
GLQEYDSNWVKELESLEEFIASVKTIVEEYEGADGSKVTTYADESFFKSDLAQKTGLMYEQSNQYIVDNQDKINLAVSHQLGVMDLIIDQAAQERQEKGRKLIGQGLLTLVSIILTPVKGVPAAIATFAKISSGSSAFSNIYEGYQEIDYGLNRDVTSESVNFVRDTICLGEQESYDFFQNASTTAMGVVGVWSGCNMIYASGGATGTTGTGNVAKYISKEAAEEYATDLITNNMAALGVDPMWCAAGEVISTAITGKINQTTPTTRAYINTTTPGLYNNVWDNPYGRTNQSAYYDFNLNRQYNTETLYLQNTGTDGSPYNPSYNRFIAGMEGSPGDRIVYSGADNYHAPETPIINSLDNGRQAMYNGSGEGGTKADVLAQNRANGRAYEQQEFAKFSSQNNNAVEQITIKTSSGVKTRVDAIGLDSNGKVVINEYKSSLTAPLTDNQKIAFPEIYESGGIVVGKGKGIFSNGYQIPPGTKVTIIRPE